MAFTLIELLVVLSVMAVLMADLHLEILATEEYDKVSETRRFWLPSDHPFGPPWDRMFQGMR